MEEGEFKSGLTKVLKKKEEESDTSDFHSCGIGIDMARYVPIFFKMKKICV